MATGDIILELNKNGRAKFPVTHENAIFDSDGNRLDAKLSIIPIRYSELVALRNSSKLLPSHYYRITDYATTTTDAESRSAGHTFDVIVMAASNNSLSEEAFASRRDGDSYFATSNLAAWKIWYCLDNDSAHFAWADTVNGKGVIYRMIDEWNNDLPYDFKNIQFKRYKITAAENYTQAASRYNGAYVACNQMPATDVAPFIRNNSDYKWFYTFSYLGATWDVDVMDGSIWRQAAYNGYSLTAANVHMGAEAGDEKSLCHTVFANGNCLTGNVSDSQMVTTTCAINVRFAQTSKDSSFFGGLGHCNICNSSRNLVLGSLRHSNIGEDFQDNIIAGYYDIVANTMGDNFNQNVILCRSFSGNKCAEQTWHNEITAYNVVENYGLLQHSTVNSYGKNFRRNRFEGGVAYCNFGEECASLHIKGQVIYCNFGSYTRYCTFWGAVDYIDTPNGDASSSFACVDVYGSIRGAASSRITLNAPEFLLASISGLKRRVRIESSTDGEIVATWRESGGALNGVVSSNNGQTWEQWDGVWKTTWQDLVTKRQQGKLVAGSRYRITDYVATTSATNTRSTAHPFDIIVLALDPHTLSEDAYAALHSGDTYFAGCNMEAWRLRYILDNDTAKYSWADTVNGKGVVYRMIDEYGNDVPYDFKSIQFKRFAIHMKEGFDDLTQYEGLYAAYSTTETQMFTVDSADFQWFYTFSKMGNSWSDAVEDYSINRAHPARNVVIGKVDYSYPFRLNDVVFGVGPCLVGTVFPVGGEWSTDIDNSSFGIGASGLSIFGEVSNVRTVTQFRNNIIFGPFRHNNIGTNFQGNIFCSDHEVSFNTIYEGVASNIIICVGASVNLGISENVIGCYIHDNVIRGGTFEYNQIIGYVAENVFNCGTTRISRNKIGPNFTRNTLDGTISNVAFEFQITDCHFSDVVASRLHGILGFVNVTGGVQGALFTNNVVGGGIRGSAASPITLNHPAFRVDGVSGNRRRIQIEADTDGGIVATWCGAGGALTGVRSTDNGQTWTNL